jgi:uncharacterized membrane protein (UPF0136 family)
MTSSRPKLIAGVIVGCVLTLAPIFGLAASVVGLIRAFDALKHGSGIGSVHARELSASIGAAVLPMVISLIIFVIGAVILFASLVPLIRSRIKPVEPPPVPPQ